MFRNALVFLAVTTTACSSASTNPGANSSTTCAARKGTYKATFTERAGTCGKINETIITFGQSGSAPSGCTGSQVTSANNCTVDINITCPLNASDSFHETGHGSWSADGTSGEAIIELVLSDRYGNFLCQSTYDINYERVQ